MKRYAFPLLLAATLCAASGVVAAKDPLLSDVAGEAAEQTPCATNENATITVMFNGREDNVDAASAKLKAKIAEIKALAHDQGFTRFIIQSSNYNINSNNFRNPAGNDGEQAFQYNGNISLSLQPANKALAFMELLTKKGYRANININSFSNGSCEQ